MSQREPEAVSRPRTGGSLLAKILFIAGVVLSAVFLVVSILSWNIWLGICALALAVLLTKCLDIVGIDASRSSRDTQAGASSAGSTRGK